MDRGSRHRLMWCGVARAAWLLLAALLVLPDTASCGLQTGAGAAARIPFWQLSDTDTDSAASELGRASRAILQAQRLAFDPNLPAGLDLPPSEIADVAGVSGFSRQGPAVDVVSEIERLEQRFGGGAKAPLTAPTAATMVQHGAASLRAATAATGMPTSYTYRRDGKAVPARPAPAAARARTPGRLPPPPPPPPEPVHHLPPPPPEPAHRLPAHQLPVVAQPPLHEVDIVMPAPPRYQTGFLPGGGVPNVTAVLGRALRQVAPDNCAVQLKDRDCITYDAIEGAFQEALRYVELDLPEVREEWSPPNVASVGQALLRTSIILADRYKLSRYEIEHILPKADTLHTSIAEICPDFASPIKCHPKLYRRIDGLCNNLHFPNWGATRRQFQRLIEPVYPDGIDAPNLEGMPSPREVSSAIHKDRDLFDHASTLMMIAWGQFMDHDFTLTFTRPDERTLNEPEDCCHNSGPEDCLPIHIARDDHFFSRFGVDCIDFVRGQPGIRQFCRLGSRAGFNVLTSVIDAGTVYGGTEEAARTLRMFEGGKLKSYMPEHFKQYGMLPLLPQRFENHDEGCIRDHPGQRCFLAGEIRVNEQLILSTMHLTWFREHNRICAILKKLNPHWDDEKIYQETRRIVIACIQHITFNEFLPMLLGKQVMKEHDLILQDHGYWNGYNEHEDPSTTLAFMTSAYRFGHSLLPTVVEKWSPTHKYIGERDLSDLIRRPFDLYEPGAVDEYILGQLNQPAMAMDFAITGEVTNLLFRQPNEEHGIDLVSLNLQRAREMGVPSYMRFREWCGLPTSGEWPQLREYVTNHTAQMYSGLYRSPWDIDLFSGGISERPNPSSMVGPTFACIIAAQMHKVRHGDRFWYELGGQPSSFTPDQLQQIRRVQLSRVLCDNTDRIRTIQVYPLVLPDYDANPRVACDSGVLPHVDLNYWREDPH